MNLHKGQSKKKKSKKKKSKKNGGSDKLNHIFEKFSKGYKCFDKYKKLYIRDMGKKNEPILMFNDIKDELPYQENMSKLNMGLHIGQRKLLLSEVQFLTKTNVQYCIYAGSAPGNKTHFLSKLFPDIKFILIDPNIFNLVLADIPNNTKITHRKQKHADITHIYYEFPTESNTYLNNKKMKDMTGKDTTKLVNFIKNSDYKIFIIEDYMNLEISTILSKLGKTTFISDIRSSIEGTVSDFDIIWNTSMVYNWINTLQPELSMVKFRIPYYEDKSDFNKYKDIYKDDFKISKQFGTDFIANYKNNVFKMSKCDLYLQAWKGPTSTEMRGYITKKNINNIVKYEVSQVENKLFYYNKILRMCYHTNKNANKSLHFCNCNDCAIENTIWTDYMKKYKSQHDLEHYIKITNIVTHRPLSKVHDINVYDIIDEDKLEQMSNVNNKSTMYTNKGTQRGNKGNIYD